MADFDSVPSLPIRVQVAEQIASRYSTSPVAGRPVSWDDRFPGIDVVRTEDGRTLRLASDGQQSCPASGWVILLSDGDAERGYRWTLYGLPAHRTPAAQTSS